MTASEQDSHTFPFQELGIAEHLCRALDSQGIGEPMGAQREAIPALLAGEDLCIESHTGSGKTLAYLLPLMTKIDSSRLETQVLIVAPTHELVLQIHKVCHELAQKSNSGLRVLLLLGGTSIDRQLDKLKKKPHIVVGSLGRVLELMDRKKLKVKGIKSLVLDEADGLFSGDKLEQTHELIKAMPDERQLVFVSATTQQKTASQIKIHSPAIVTVGQAEAEDASASPRKATISPLIEHCYIELEQRDKPEVLRKILHASKADRIIVFVHKSEMAEELTERLEFHNISVSNLHGARHKLDRAKAMEDFRNSKSKVLITSDVAARGIDIAGVTHVVNYDPPASSLDYTHRAGRVGRAGLAGTAISLISENEMRMVKRYRRELGIEVTEVYLREGAILPVAQAKEE
jgi:superfamily II DNA/RNA helicase